MLNRDLYMQKLIPFIDSPLVKILTGIRRSGKSTILLLLIEELKKRGVREDQIVYLNFDSLKYESLTDYKELYKVITAEFKAKDKLYVLLDEIQEVKDWEKAVNSLCADYNADIYITGSNSRMLSSEISTYLTGRYISITVYPLSFNEYLDFTASYRKLEDKRKEFLNYLIKGGFPAVNLREYDRESAYTIVKDIYNSTIFKDIVQRNNIRKTEQLERIVKFVFDNVGKTFSAKSISDYFKSQQRKIDIESIYNYLSLLEKAFIVYKAQRYDITGKEILKTQEKYYLADPALKYAILGYQTTSVAAMLENIVYLELKRQGYEVYIGKYNEKEIDFVSVRQDERIYIQVAVSVLDPDTLERELSPLQKIPDHYQKYLLTLDDILPEGDYNGIKRMSVIDFLSRQR